MLINDLLFFIELQESPVFSCSKTESSTPVCLCFTLRLKLVSGFQLLIRQLRIKCLLKMPTNNITGPVTYFIKANFVWTSDFFGGFFQNCSTKTQSRINLLDQGSILTVYGCSTGISGGGALTPHGSVVNENETVFLRLSQNPFAVDSFRWNKMSKKEKSYDPNDKTLKFVDRVDEFDCK